jgi:hypothetical protein
MMRRKRLEYLVNEHNMLKVVNNALAVQEVHCRRKPIPIQGLREAQPARPAWYIGNSDNLLERNDLNSCDNDDDVDVAGGQGGKEAAYHDECPYRAGDEGLFLLFVL